MFAKFFTRNTVPSKQHKDQHQQNSQNDLSSFFMIQTSNHNLNEKFTYELYWSNGTFYRKINNRFIPYIWFS